MFPNPVTAGRVNFGFDLPAAGEVRLAVYDAAYRLVAVREHAVPTGGPHVVTWRVGDWAPGVYVVRAVCTWQGGRRILPAEKFVVRNR